MILVGERAEVASGLLLSQSSNNGQGSYSIPLGTSNWGNEEVGIFPVPDFHLSYLMAKVIENFFEESRQ